MLNYCQHKTSHGVECINEGIVTGSKGDGFWFCRVCASSDDLAARQLDVYDKRAQSLSGGSGGRPERDDGTPEDSFKTPVRMGYDQTPESAKDEALHGVQFLEFTSSMSALVALDLHEANLLPDGSNFSKSSEYKFATELFGVSTAWDRRSMRDQLSVAWESRFSLGNEGSGLPWMTSLPLGLYLIPPVALLDHPAAVIEAFAAQALDLLEDNSEQFWDAVDNCYYGNVGADEGIGSSATRAKSKEAKGLKRVDRLYSQEQVLRRVDAFGSAMQTSVAHLWKEDHKEFDDTTTLVLPYASITGALGAHASVAAIQRLAAVFAIERQNLDSCVGFWKLCEELNEALEACGISHREPPDLKDKTLRMRLQFFTKAIQRGRSSPKKKAKKQPYFSMGEEGETRDRPERDEVNQRPIDLLQERFSDRTFESKDERRRQAATAAGLGAGGEMPGRYDVLPGSSGGHRPTPRHDVEALASVMERDRTMSRIAGGSCTGGGVNFKDTPDHVKKAIYTGKGDTLIKIGHGGATMALAPGIERAAVTTLTAGMMGFMMPISESVAKKLVMREYGAIHPMAMQIVLLHNSLPMQDSLASKTSKLGDVEKFLPSGPELIGFLDGLVQAATLLDGGSAVGHAAELQALSARVVMARNHGCTVATAYAAMRAQFLTYSAALHAWCGPCAIGPEPKVTDCFLVADRLWKRADAMALLSTSTDPAWIGIARKKTAAPAKDKHRSIPAHGDGVDKVRGGTGWPNHLQNPICMSYKRGKDCRWGENCHKYCYLTKDKPRFKP